MEVIIDTEPGVHNNLNGMLIGMDSILPAHAIVEALDDSDDFLYPKNYQILSASMVESDFEIAKDIAPSFSSYCRLVFMENWPSPPPPPLTELTRSCILPFSVDVKKLIESIRNSARKYSHIEEVECRQVDTTALSAHWSGYDGIQIVEVRLKCPRTALLEGSLVNIFQNLLAESKEEMKQHEVPPFSLHLLGYERSKRNERNSQFIG